MECTGVEHLVPAVLLSMLNVLLAKMVNSVMNVIQASGTFKRTITSRVDSQRQIVKFMTWQMLIYVLNVIKVIL